MAATVRQDVFWVWPRPGGTRRIDRSIVNHRASPCCFAAGHSVARQKRQPPGEPSRAAVLLCDFLFGSGLAFATPVSSGFYRDDDLAAAAALACSDSAGPASPLPILVELGSGNPMAVQNSGMV
jgi:hypothetical protein